MMRLRSKIDSTGTRRGLAREVAFRGGTALHKLHIDPPARYSEDIDLVQVNAGSIGPILGAMRARPVTPLKLKIEINTREHFCVLGLKRIRFHVDSPWFGGATDVLTYRPEELLGTKLRALYQRKKGRDLFDLDEALVRLPELDADAVVACFSRYMEHDGQIVTRSQFERNLATKVADERFYRDVPPILAAGRSFDLERAHERVRQILIARLPDTRTAGKRRPSPR